MLFLMQGGSVKIISGDKLSIGNLHSMEDTAFTNHILSFESGDTLLLASDGITDQFGGVFEKKFMRKRLITLLESSNNLTGIRTGEVLEDVFQNWKGENEQTDDVMVLGIKM